MSFLTTALTTSTQASQPHLLALLPTDASKVAGTR